MTIHTATVIAKQIQGTLADSAGDKPNANAQKKADQSFQQQLDSKELPGQKNVSEASLNQHNSLQTASSQTKADQNVAANVEKQGLSKQEITDIIVERLRDAVDDTYNPDPDNFGGGSAFTQGFINLLKASQFGIAITLAPVFVNSMKHKEE